jgi:hypothetical protein
MRDREEALERAVKSGALVRYHPQLERGEHHVRRLWLRPNVLAALSPEIIGQDQVDRVHAALRRFVVGGLFNIVSNTSPHAGVSNLGDLRELKTDSPPFFEMRFKPPQRDLRLFGSFICQDGLVLTSAGMKSLEEKKVGKPIKIPEELRRCAAFFEAQAFDSRWIPFSIEGSITNANII